ncbi:hypothetical protein [Thalassovita aquimarina]|uniref:PDZ domain-containing protein n=1 Tax=Thalassovita aquimarina TaxID=2785917 RepID=A0ABS5HL14_9RHOB|nr:hypothetical protein [Thalassovita aquimarina]MBR9649666.1 hypothetical protein [Thalassovita aquimarina]
MIHPKPPEQPAEVHLELTRVSGIGQSLGLRPGDKLVGLDGMPFTDGARELARRFSPMETKKVALHFQRADLDLTVISVTPMLGRWRPCPAVGNPKLPQIDTDRVENWEVLRSQDGRYDLFRHRASPLIWFAAPIWLAHMRLWPYLGGMIALVMLGWPAGWWASALLYVLASAYVRRNYAQLIRSDRLARGLVPFAVVAAHSESAAHATYANMEPDDRFAFGNASVPPAAPKVHLDDAGEHAEAEA